MGTLVVGYQLPTVKEVAATLATNPDTVLGVRVNGDPAVETRGLTKRYRSKPALADCTITAPSGRISALVLGGRRNKMPPSSPKSASP